MWTVVAERRAEKALKKLPRQVAEKYAYWYGIVVQLGPEGLRHIKGFHDEALKGDLAGYRSSRLSLQYRVIYAVQADVITIHVINITPHEY